MPRMLSPTSGNVNDLAVTVWGFLCFMVMWVFPSVVTVALETVQSFSIEDLVTASTLVKEARLYIFRNDTA